MEDTRLNETTQITRAPRSDDEEYWSTESTRGSLSGSEATPAHLNELRPDASDLFTRPAARRPVPPQTGALNSRDINVDLHCRFRGLTPPPLSSPTAPRKKRSLGTMLRDDSGSPQPQDKLSKELESMEEASYVLKHDNMPSGSAPRTLPEEHQSIDVAAASQDHGGSGFGLPVTEVSPENGTVNPASSESARVSSAPFVSSPPRLIFDSP